MGWGAIIAGAMGGGAEQAANLADRQISDRVLDESKMRELRERAALERQRLLYQHKLDMQRLMSERRYGEERYGIERKDKQQDADAQHRRNIELYEAQKKPDIYKGSDGTLYQVAGGEASPVMIDRETTDTRPGVKPNEPATGSVSRAERVPFKPQADREWTFTTERGFPELVNRSGDRKNAPKPPGSGWKFDADEFGGGIWANDQKGEAWRIEPDGSMRKMQHPDQGQSIPVPAIAELRSDPSAGARREFDEVFGEGAADRILSQPSENPEKPSAPGAAERIQGKPTTASPRESHEQAKRRNEAMMTAMPVISEARDLLFKTNFGQEIPAETLQILVTKLEKALDEPLRNAMKTEIRQVLGRLRGVQTRHSDEMSTEEKQFARGFDQAYKSIGP